MTRRQATRRYILLRGLRWMPLGTLLPFMVLLPQSRGLSLGAIGALWAVHSVVALALEVPSGAVADSYGRRRALLGGAALQTGALTIYAVAAGPVGFALALAGLAAGRSLLSGSLDAWFVDTLRAEDPEAPLRSGLSMGSAADGVGLSIGALLGGFLPLAFDHLPRTGDGVVFLSPVALLAAGISAVYLVATAVLVHEQRPQAAAVPVRERLREVAQTAQVSVRSSRVLRTILVTALAFGAAVMAIELLWQPRLAELLGDADDHTVLFGVLVAGSMAALAVGASVSPRVLGPLGARRGYAVVIALSAVAIGLLAVAGTPVAFAASFLLLYGVLGLGDPLHFELLHEATTSEVRATVMSVEALAQQAGGGVGNLVLGLVASTSGFGLAFAIPAVLVGATVVLVLRLPRTGLVVSDAVRRLPAS